jgi:hypothetical protein
MKKKGKKGQAAPFILAPKTGDIEAQVKESQLKKKLLEEKYRNSKRQTEETVKKLTEARGRLMEVSTVKENENEKFNCIKADYDHQMLLIRNNYRMKIENLQSIQKERNDEIELLKTKLKKMKEDHTVEIEKKNKMLLSIKNGMDELSQSFSVQLGDIQNNLKDQIEKISIKWEHNLSDHVEKFKTSVDNYKI